MKKTILLENDDWLWTGCDEWCKSFDENYIIHRTEQRDWMYENDLIAVGKLSQPFVGRIMTCSAFESTIYTPLRKDVYFQVEHWLNIIEAAFVVRQSLGYEPFEILINYNGNDFLEDLLNDTWGDGFKRSLMRFVRQQPKLLIKIYSEFEQKYILSETLFDLKMSEIKKQ